MQNTHPMRYPEKAPLTERLTWQISLLVILAALACVVSLPLVNWLTGTSWHDQERMGQVIAIGVALLAGAYALGFGDLPLRPLVARRARRLIALVLVVALVSAVLAPQPLWAFTEVALGLACVGLAWLVAHLRRAYGKTADRVLLAVLAFTCAGLMARFLVAYAATVAGGEKIFNVWLLLDGFSNPRFYGQFLTLALPLLLAPLLASGSLRRYAVPAAVLAALVWMVAIASGTRGTWLGAGCATLLLACTGTNGRRFALVQLIVAAVGLLLFWIFIHRVPELLGMTLANDAASRLTTSLSERGTIWQQAIEVALRHPLLGIGPMQLADLPNGIAAHPHQAWLQWAAELGFPSAFLVTWLVLRGGVKLLAVVHTRAHSTLEEDLLRVCIAASVVGSLTQAMVDGVFVMPYSQLWLALMAGWLIGLQPETSSSAPNVPMSKRGVAPWLALLIVCMAWLGFVVVRDYPHLAQREQTYIQTFHSYLKPRFWLQGIIAAKPCEVAGRQTVCLTPP